MVVNFLRGVFYQTNKRYCDAVHSNLSNERVMNTRWNYLLGRLITKDFVKCVVPLIDCGATGLVGTK